MSEHNNTLDEIDRRILNALQIDASQTNSELAVSYTHLTLPTKA